MKYKVGDRVRVKPDAIAPRLKEKMSLGKTVVIKNALNNAFGIRYFDTNGGYWYEQELEPVSGQKIIIYTDGKTTTARLVEGKKTIKESVAKCAPDDDFNFETGARLAFDRMFKAKKERPKLLEKFEIGKRYRFTKRLFDLDGGTAYKWDVEIDGDEVSPYSKDHGDCGKYVVLAEWCEETGDTDV